MGLYVVDFPPIVDLTGEVVNAACVLVFTAAKHAVSEILEDSQNVVLD